VWTATRYDYDYDRVTEPGLIFPMMARANDHQFVFLDAIDRGESHLVRWTLATPPQMDANAVRSYDANEHFCQMTASDEFVVVSGNRIEDEEWAGAFVDVYRADGNFVIRHALPPQFQFSCGDVELALDGRRLGVAAAPISFETSRSAEWIESEYLHVLVLDALSGEVEQHASHEWPDDDFSIGWIGDTLALVLSRSRRLETPRRYETDGTVLMTLSDGVISELGVIGDFRASVQSGGMIIGLQNNDDGQVLGVFGGTVSPWGGTSPLFGHIEFSLAVFGTQPVASWPGDEVLINAGLGWFPAPPTHAFVTTLDGIHADVGEDRIGAFAFDRDHHLQWVGWECRRI
jgi:hypothetical protein